MIENNTDRLFWTLAVIIVGSLLLTIGLKTFPNMEHNAMSALTNITKSVNTTNPSTEQKFIGGFNPNPNDAIGTKVNPDGNATKINTHSPSINDPDAQAKSKAVDAHHLMLNVKSNGDGTGVLVGPYNTWFGGVLVIPKYVLVDEKLTKITSIRYQAFDSNQLTAVTIPDSVTDIGYEAFYGNILVSATIPNSVINIEEGAFAGNNLTSINIPNQQTYQSAKTNNAFDSNVNLTNNPS